MSCFFIFISTFSPNVLLLSLSFSMMGGTGLGMMYVAAMVAVPPYFEKRRSLAMGQFQKRTQSALTRKAMFSKME